MVCLASHLLVSCTVYASALIMETIFAAETYVGFEQTTRRYSTVRLSYVLVWIRTEHL
jgi:hypothetical protein